MASSQPPTGYPTAPVPPPVPMGMAAFSIAGFGRRVGALIIDFVIMGVVGLVLGAILQVPGMVSTTTSAYGTTNTQVMLYNTGWSQVLMAGISAVYCIECWSIWAWTPGQRIVGLRVYQASAPEALSQSMAAVRWALLFGVPSGVGAVALVAPSTVDLLGLAQLGWIVALIVTTLESPLTQGLHDQQARSIVVHS